MINRKFGHGYPRYEPKEEEKYLPSMFFDLPIGADIHKMEARPLIKDTGYYTIIMNNYFLAHIHKLGEIWCDFLGKTDEIYRLVGNLIEMQLKKPN